MGRAADGRPEHAGQLRLHLPEPDPSRVRGPHLSVLARRELQPDVLAPGRRRDKLVTGPHADHQSRGASLREVRRERRRHDPRGVHEPAPRRAGEHRPRLQHLLRTRARRPDRAGRRSAGGLARRSDRAERGRSRVGRDSAGLDPRCRRGRKRQPRARVRQLSHGDRPPLPLRALDRQRMAGDRDRRGGRFDRGGSREVAALLRRHHTRPRGPVACLPLAAGGRGRLAGGDANDPRQRLDLEHRDAVERRGQERPPRLAARHGRDRGRAERDLDDRRLLELRGLRHRHPRVHADRGERAADRGRRAERQKRARGPRGDLRDRWGTRSGRVDRGLRVGLRRRRHH